MGAMLSVLKHSRASEWLGLLGKAAGLVAFGALIYSYCNVLLESCLRGVR